jgi:hypothetical protein
MPQRKLIKDIWFLRSTKMVLGRFDNNLLNMLGDILGMMKLKPIHTALFYFFLMIIKTQAKISI